MRLKNYLLLAALLLLGSTAWATQKPKKNQMYFPPDPGSFVTEAVYITTISCVDNTAGGSAVVISTRPVLIFTTNITTVGAAGSTLQFFDSVNSTSGVPALTPPITGATAMPWHWNIGSSSGATVRAAGGFCWGMAYMER